MSMNPWIARPADGYIWSTNPPESCSAMTSNKQAGACPVAVKARLRRSRVHTSLARYSSATCPKRRNICFWLNLPFSKSLVRLNATAPA